MSGDIITVFTLFYTLFSFCFVVKTNEFVSAGITIENFLSFFIGREIDNFVFYHIKRSSFTFLVHASLLLGYRVLLSWITDYPLMEDGLTVLNIIGTVGLLLTVTSAVTVYWWSRNNWENHPVSQKLSIFCNAGTSWRTLASVVNVEYLRVQKLTIKCSALEEVIITDNWIIKMTPYSMFFGHQSVAVLNLDTAEEHPLSASGTGSAQYLNIKVSFTQREENHHFYFRINAFDFKELEEKLNIPIDVAQNIVFHRSKTDQFLEVFKHHILQNPPYQFTEEVETCSACIVNPSNVKLVKNCTDDGPNPCGTCYCRRPMWCLSCMGRWFASRQEQEPQDTWLSSKCMCPGCRSLFCILDICPVEQ